MSKWSKKVIIGVSAFLSIALLLPLSWIFFKGITINWATLTEEWYKTLLTPFVSTVLFGFVAFLFMKLWEEKNHQFEINKLIIEQKKIAEQIVLNCDLETIKIFLSNNNQIIQKQTNSLYLEGIVNGDKIIDQMLFYIREKTDNMLREEAKKDIKEFCENFI